MSTRAELVNHVNAGRAELINHVNASRVELVNHANASRSELVNQVNAICAEVCLRVFHSFEAKMLTQFPVSNEENDLFS